MFFKFPPKKDEVATPKKFAKWLYTAAALFILADLAGAGYLLFEEIHKDRIYPGIRIGSIDVGGKKMEEARQAINQRVNEINQEGFEFKTDNDKISILPIISSFGGDIAKEVISFRTDETVKQAYMTGRGRGFLQNLIDKINLLRTGQEQSIIFSTNDGEIKKILGAKFFIYEQPGSDAKLYATTTPNYWKKEVIFKIADERPGFRFDYEKALEEMKAKIKNLDNSGSIAIGSIQEYPDIKKNECLNIEAQASQFLEKAELTLLFNGKKWAVNKDTIASWLALSRGTENKIILDLDRQKVESFLNEKISPDINIKPLDARFEIKDNRVIEFASSVDGQKVDTLKTIANLRSSFLAEESKEVEIAVEPVKSQVKTENVNQLGVKELIGTGRSNFSGSPKNRIHNIRTGAKAVNGTLVPPGEEFSTNNTLGDVTAETGYLPEMTIKGDKTVPEYGGGLCQVGTTLFRAALESGLPITARRAHSYRVSYYEPAGTDATIYGPWPDLRFKNDTENYILIQSRIDGNDIYFDFWGTKDGRTVEKTDPTIYNIVKPAPTKLIETTDLPVGQKKCTERSHNGADAYFDYKVTYADGTIEEERFKSHYVPWQEVCLIGVEKKATSTAPTSQ
jgi:vancomycin resistance protein YoaR